MINDCSKNLNQSGIRGTHISTECEDVLTLGYADDMAEGSDLVISLQSLIIITSGFYLRKKNGSKFVKNRNYSFKKWWILRNYKKWYFRRQEIEVDSAYEYLGLTITPKLIWTQAKKTLATQVKNIL